MKPAINRRDFILGATAFSAAGCGTPRLRPVRTPASTRGVVVSAKDLSGDFDWPKLAQSARLTTIATHVGPEDVIPFLKGEFGRRFMDDCNRRGIAVEHELHALNYLLPRSLFSKNPEMFMMNKDGTRDKSAHCCVSNSNAINIIAERAVETAKICRPTTGRYYFWLSDDMGICRCPKCRGLSGPDQALIIENAIVKALRSEIDPEATLSHLAYQATLDVPTEIKPDPALFLEFAPFRRWGGTTKRLPLEEGGMYLTKLDALLQVFPAETTQVLEYWLDESLFSRWKKPLVRIPWNREKTIRDIAAYAKRDIRHITSFAVSIGDDYVKEFGGDSLSCVKEYGELLIRHRRGQSPRTRLSAPPSTPPS